MSTKIERFEITNLHGYKNYSISFLDNSLIFVGENGSGKTTIIRLLYYMLSGQWTLLAQYNFTEISITINNRKYSLKHSLLDKRIEKIDERLLRRFPPSVRRRFSIALEQSQGILFRPELEKLCDEYNIPVSYLLGEMELFDTMKSDGKSLKELFESITNAIDFIILYLPTYRRIEQELNFIFKGAEFEEARHRRPYVASNNKLKTHVELIEFGMKDVVEAINNILGQLKDFARDSLNTLTLQYLGDVVDKVYLKVKLEEIQNASEETIKNVLDRIHEKILSKQHKDHLFEKISAVRIGGKLDEHAQVICHYLLKLLRFQEDLRAKEFQMTTFCDVCNEYLEDKRFNYDSANFKFSIQMEKSRNREHIIELRHLSSGEKQIVSLFSHLYLSGEHKYLVLIDEPELSLSVLWQKKFLADIKKGGFCSGIIAATHSPFIYDNELEKYARSIGEFEGAKE